MLATRESRARALAAATAATVVALSALFAVLRNPAREAAPAPSTSGRAAFERMNCLSCHSLAEQGDGIPLDGVGARLTRAQLRDWAFGGGAAVEQLPAAIARTKQRHANDPEGEALLDYLQQL